MAAALPPAVARPAPSSRRAEPLADELFGEGFARPIVVGHSAPPSFHRPAAPKSRDDAARTALATANYDLATTANAQVALAIGRLDAEHRFGDLVRAWRIVTARRPEARLWIVGDGPEREELYHQIGDLDQRFRALLPGTFDCLDELLQASDMLLVPAPHAIPPLVMLEAQAAGLPSHCRGFARLTRSSIAPEKRGCSIRRAISRPSPPPSCDLMEHPATAVDYGAAAARQPSRNPTPARRSSSMRVYRATCISK